MGRRRSRARNGAGAPERQVAAADLESRLHEERLDAVMRRLRGGGARSVIDLGCGSGALIRRLLHDPTFERIVGIDASFDALASAELLRTGSGPDQDQARLSLLHGSFTSDLPAESFDAAVMVETVEHVPTTHLSGLERALFTRLRPRLVIVTTPNREYNPLLGIPDSELRRPDHRFEWDRQRFRAWAEGVADRNGFRVEFEPVGPRDPIHGPPTQMAVFQRA